MCIVLCSYCTCWATIGSHGVTALPVQELVQQGGLKIVNGPAGHSLSNGAIRRAQRDLHFQSLPGLAACMFDCGKPAFLAGLAQHPDLGALDLVSLRSKPSSWCLPSCSLHIEASPHESDTAYQW